MTASMNYVSFQAGSLTKRLTKDGFAWILRYYADGKRKAMNLGTDKELPTEKEARKKAASMSAIINESKKTATFAQLIERYRNDELSVVRPGTASSYKTELNRIEAKYGEMPLDAVLSDLMGIGSWLGELTSEPTKTCPGRPLSKKTRQNVKAVLHRLIGCAMRWGVIPVGENPIALVEIRIRKGIVLPKKRAKYPLNAAQIKSLIEWSELSEHVCMMVKLCVFLGLRISEVLALRWENIDFDGRVIHIMSSAVGKHIDETKTANSDAVLPCHQFLIDALKAWKESTPVVKGWVFGSVITGRPFHRDSLQTDHLKPAGIALGIVNLGWHSFRHTQIARLRKNGTASEVQMMLMRHADMRTTNSYGRDDGSMELKRPAHEAMVDALLKEIAS